MGTRLTCNFLQCWLSKGFMGIGEEGGEECSLCGGGVGPDVEKVQALAKKRRNSFVGLTILSQRASGHRGPGWGLHNAEGYATMRRAKSALLLAPILIGMAAIPCSGSEVFVPPQPRVPSGGVAADRGRSLSEGMPDPIKPISSLGTDIAAKEGRMPTDYAMTAFPDQRVAAPEQVSDGPWTGFHWEAPGTCHRPLYFENPSLERHGYSLGLAQPFASAAHFVGSAAILPYRMVAEPTCECVYTLGHERPGTATPLRYYRPPLSLSGGVAQAGTVTGLIFLLP